MTIKSTQKIVAALLSVAMVLTLVVGLTAVSANAQTTVTFSKNLTVGSRGADVTALQAMLNAKGLLSVAPTGYFGSLTKAAVVAWQASVGLPSTGYFGPMSRAYIATNGTGTTGTSTPVAGCPTGAIYNTQTGALCSTGGTTTTPGTEGTLEVNQAATPANNANIQSSTDVQAYGLDLRAKLGDVKVDRADLEVSVYNTSTSSYENPGNFINTIKAWDGATLLKSWTVGSADFIKDSSNVYYIRLSDIGLNVPKDGMKNLVFSFNTNAGIDNDRNVVVSGYGTNSLRTSSGNNVVSYYNIDTVSRTHTFKKPGAATITVGGDSANPLSTNYQVTTSSGVSGVTMQVFSVRANDGDAKVTGATVKVAAVGTLPTTLALYDGSTLLDSRSVTSAGTTTFSFSNRPVTVAKDTTKSLTVKADFSNSTSNGTTATTTVTTVSYDKPNGSSATTNYSEIAGTVQSFYTATAQLMTVSPATPTVINNTNTSTSTRIEGNITFKVKPMGGSMTLPTASDIVVKVGTTTSPYITVASKNLKVTADNGQVVSAGQTLNENTVYTLSLDVAASNAEIPASGYYTFYVTSFASTVNGVLTTQTTGLDNVRTGSAYFAD